MSLGSLFYMNRHDRRILLVLLSLAVGGFMVVWLLGENGEPELPSKDIDSKISRESGFSRTSRNPRPSSTPPSYYRQPERQAERFAFDPNTADSTQLLRLGLQPWMVRNIYKYRAAGGIYRTKTDFAQLYGLTAKQYRELEPYIQISADYRPASEVVKPEKPFLRDTTERAVKIVEGETVDLNVGDTNVYKRVPGIGSFFAKEIVRLQKRLGGFVSVDQLDEIDHFPPAAKAYFALKTADVRKIPVNQLSLDELRRHPYINYYQARAIIDYRRQHGPVRSLRELQLLPDFTEEAIRRLEPYVSYD
jgi:DNA uptake protein ComE-like DNA-binding protein